MLRKWELLASQPVFESEYISIYSDKLKRPDGTIVDNYFTVKRKDATYIVALTLDRRVIVVRQYKNGAKDLVYELPAGFVEDKEEPKTTAARELLEETGYTGKNIKHLASLLPNMGGSGNLNHYFLITEVSKVAEQNLDINEEIEVDLFSLDDLVENIKKRKSFFLDSESQLALLLSWEELKNETFDYR